VQTIENLRKRLVTDGFERALDRKKRQEPPTPCKLDGEAEAKVIAMRLGKPAAGYGHWTLQLLADELVALEVVDSISHETVRKTLTADRVTSVGRRAVAVSQSYGLAKRNKLTTPFRPKGKSRIWGNFNDRENGEDQQRRARFFPVSIVSLD
jgi:hypothetical protein